MMYPCPAGSLPPPDMKDNMSRLVLCRCEYWLFKQFASLCCCWTRQSRTQIREQMSSPEISWYGKSILGCGLWLGLDRGKKGSGPILSNFFGWFFQFFMGKKKIFWIFCPWQIEKNTPKSCSKLAQTPFSHSTAQATANSPKLIFHVMKYRDQTFVLLSVIS